MNLRNVSVLAIYVPAICMLISCGKPDPYDEVRNYRRQYKLEYDFTVSDENQELGLEIRVQNLAGKLKLQDLTVDIEALDGEQRVIWSSRESLDVSAIGKLSTKSFEFFETLDNADRLEYLNVTLAPDGPDSDFKTYKEFIRVAAK